MAVRDIYVQDKSISKLAGTHRIKLPAVHDNIVNRKYVEKKDLNKNFASNGYDIVMLCEPEKLEECMNLAKEERKKLLETVLIPQAKASLYAYEIELEKIKANNIKNFLRIAKQNSEIAQKNSGQNNRLSKQKMVSNSANN